MDEPLFDDPIQAWEHGPVVPTLYQTYKELGSKPIPPPEKGIDASLYPDGVIELLDEVFQVYGQYSASKLRNMTHSEPPWVNAHNIAPSTEISHDSMKDYFKTLLNE